MEQITAMLKKEDFKALLPLRNQFASLYSRLGAYDQSERIAAHDERKALVEIHGEEVVKAYMGYIHSEVE